MNPLLSVIIPVYKVEKYLHQCVDSVRNQTYQNLEIILVDDGSPDKCGKLCDQFANEDNRIKVIHKQNGGQAEARNTGLSYVTGEYISFVDGDDWLNPDLYECVMKAVPYSMAIYGCTFMDDNEGVVETRKAIEKSEIVACDSFEKIQELLCNSLLGYSANKIYAANAIKNIEFSNAVFREDLLFNLEALRKMDSVFISDNCGYYYRQHEASTLHQQYSGVVPDAVSVMESMLVIHPGFTEAQNRRLSNQLIKVYLTDIIGKCVVNNVKLNKKEQRQAVNEIFASPVVSRKLKRYKDECSLFHFLTICYKWHLPNLFLEIYRRKYVKQ